MVVNSVIVASLAILSPPGAGEPQHRRGDQDEALAARKQGRILPLRDIEQRIVPTMKNARYIGVDFDPTSTVYTLKFLRDGNIIWVSVDGRSGAVIGRAGG